MASGYKLLQVEMGGKSPNLYHKIPKPASGGQEEKPIILNREMSPESMHSILSTIDRKNNNLTDLQNK